MPASLPSTVKWFRFICWAGVAIWAATVFYLSSQGNADLAEDLPFFAAMWDKGLHFAAFFCGALPLVPALRLTYGWSWKKVCWLTIGALSLYGALDEVHQLWTPSRTGLSVEDWIADTLGAAAGAPFAAFIHALIETPHRQAPAGN